MEFGGSAGIVALIADVARGVASWGVPLIGLVGVLAGAGVTAALSRANDARRVVSDIRREVYFETMDIAMALFGQLRILNANAPRGKEDPEADAMAADAIQAVSVVIPQFERIEARIATVGSPAVTEAAYEFRRGTLRYMEELGRQIQTDQVFRVGVGVIHFDEYASTLDRLARAIRADLGLPLLSSVLPATREARTRRESLAAPGWYADPTGRYPWRWWNGAFWDRMVSTHGKMQEDPESIRTYIA